MSAFGQMIALFAITVGSCCIWTLVYKFCFDPLRALPGPFAARITPLWELSQVRQNRFEKVNRDLHRQYGPIVRIGPNKYSLSDPQVIKKVYGHGSKFEKGAFYHAFGNPNSDLADLFSERDVERHSAKRRRVAQLYSMTALVSYEEFVDRCIVTLEGRLHEFAAQHSPIDIPDWMQYYAFDVIGEISIGEPFGFLEQGRDFNGIIGAIHEAMAYGSQMGIIPALHPVLGWITSKLDLPIPFRVVQDYINTHEHARMTGKQDTDRRDFLSKLVDLRSEGRITDLDLQTTMGANIAAGSDTTGLTLSAIIYHLARNPSICKKLRQEIDEAEQRGDLSDPITFHQSQKLPYLQAIIRESLRIHPATGQPLIRVVPSGGVELAGQFFPAGSQVGTNPWIIHFDTSIYGADADTFNPERWLQHDQERLKTMEANMMTFGTGARTCIGKNISLLEISKVIPQIFRRFVFRLEDPMKEWELETKWFVKQKFRCFAEAL